jgi:hypothetical protein
MPMQYRVNWSGTTGGAGVSVFNARWSVGSLGSLQPFADAVRVFFDSLKAIVPNEVSWTFPAEVQEFDTSSGQLKSVHAVTAPASVSATSSGSFAHASGARIDWHTPAIVNGRRLRGRTYMVPLVNTSFGPDGLVTTTARTTLTNAGNALINALATPGSLAVWSRTHGILADVQSPHVSSLGSVLRTRRD